MPTTRRKAAESTPATSTATSAARVRTMRRERLAAMLTRVRALVTPEILGDVTGESEWYPLAACHAFHPESFCRDFQRVGKNLAEAITKSALEDLTVPLVHVRVLNLLYSCAWVADPSRDPVGWPRRSEEEQ